MAHQTRIVYVELKSGHHDNGPAWIGRVRFSKSGRSVYYRGRRLQRGSGVGANYFDTETGEEYWVSGPKRNGEDRHWAGSGSVIIDPDVAEEYWRDIRGREAEQNAPRDAHKTART